MENKVLCPKWGRCKATKKCPLEEYNWKHRNEFGHFVPLFDVYVYSKCANKNVEVIKRA